MWVCFFSSIQMVVENKNFIVGWVSEDFRNFVGGLGTQAKNR